MLLRHPHSPSWATAARSAAAVMLLSAAGAVVGCGGTEASGAREITISGSVVGAEGELLQRQLKRFMAENPGLHVSVQRTPDDATQRHQLYVQWLNAHVGDPDVLQLDVVWTAEFAAAGWIRALSTQASDFSQFFPAAIEANTWNGRVYALPWFVDVGMLYWRTDLMDHAPRSLEELKRSAAAARARSGGPEFGIVWQGARYEGLVTVFMEYLGAFGGQIMADDGRVVVDSPAAVRALEFMKMELDSGLAPRQVLNWHEEETRFAFQNGEAVMMRNWPYASALMNDSTQSKVAGRFSVAAMPGAEGGSPTAALGGAELAVNAYSDDPDGALALVEFLTAPAQMLERAEESGYYPARPALYDDPRLDAALAVSPQQARDIVMRARPRPVTPIYSQMSELLQIQLHRSLTGQASAADALRTAAAQMNALAERTGVRELMARQRSEAR